MGYSKDEVLSLQQTRMISLLHDLKKDQRYVKSAIRNLYRDDAGGNDDLSERISRFDDVEKKLNEIMMGIDAVHGKTARGEHIDARFTETKDVLGAVRGSVEDVQSRQGVIEKKLEEMNAVVGGYQVDVLQTRFGVLSNNLAHLGADIKTRLSEIDKGLKPMETISDAFEAMVEDLDEKLPAIHKDIGKQLGVLPDIHHRLERIDEKLIDLEVIQTRLNSIEDAIKDINTDGIANINEELRGLAAQCVETNRKIDSLQKSVSLVLKTQTATSEALQLLAKRKDRSDKNLNQLGDLQERVENCEWTFARVDGTVRRIEETLLK